MATRAASVEEIHPPGQEWLPKLPPTQAQRDTVARIIDETNAQRPPPLGTLGVRVNELLRYGQRGDTARSPYIGDMYNQNIYSTRYIAGIRHFNGLKTNCAMLHDKCIERETILSVITPDGEEHIYAKLFLDLENPDEVDFETGVPLRHCYITFWDNKPIEEVQPPGVSPSKSHDVLVEKLKRLRQPEWTEGGRRRKSMKRKRKKTKRTLRRNFARSRR